MPFRPAARSRIITLLQGVKRRMRQLRIRSARVDYEMTVLRFELGDRAPTLNSDPPQPSHPLAVPNTTETMATEIESETLLNSSIDPAFRPAPREPTPSSSPRTSDGIRPRTSGTERSSSDLLTPDSARRDPLASLGQSAEFKSYTLSGRSSPNGHSGQSTPGMFHMSDSEGDTMESFSTVMP